MNLADITPLVLTYNEGPNLARTLAALSWAARVVVVDSGSTDDTLQICRESPGVDVHTRPFDSFAAQRTFGLTLVRTPWVLSFDADYVLTDEGLAELRGLSPVPDVRAYEARFAYCVHGRRLRGSLYPPRIVLFRHEGARYEPEGHSERLVIDGRCASLAAEVRHDDRKPLDRWWADQWRYARQEAVHLLRTPRSELNAKDRLRRDTPVVPALVLLYGLVYRRLLLDGWAGCFYVTQRLLAELVLLLLLTERRLTRTTGAAAPAVDHTGETRA